MRNRVSKRFARIPGSHGEAAAPAFYPVSINPGFWGVPWAKVEEQKYTWLPQFIAFFFMASFVLRYELSSWRLCYHGTYMFPRPIPLLDFLPCADLDDPDHFVKMEAYRREKQQGVVGPARYNSSNYLASYLWQPGDPEPDIRRKRPPAHH